MAPPLHASAPASAAAATSARGLLDAIHTTQARGGRYAESASEGAPSAGFEEKRRAKLFMGSKTPSKLTKLTKLKR